METIVRRKEPVFCRCFTRLKGRMSIGDPGTFIHVSEKLIRGKLRNSTSLDYETKEVTKD